MGSPVRIRLPPLKKASLRRGLFFVEVASVAGNLFPPLLRSCPAGALWGVPPRPPATVNPSGAFCFSWRDVGRVAQRQIRLLLPIVEAHRMWRATRGKSDLPYFVHKKALLCTKCLIKPISYARGAFRVRNLTRGRMRAFWRYPAANLDRMRRFWQHPTNLPT